MLNKVSFLVVNFFFITILSDDDVGYFLPSRTMPDDVAGHHHRN